VKGTVNVNCALDIDSQLSVMPVHRTYHSRVDQSEYRNGVPMREMVANRWLTYAHVKRILNSQREFHNRR
jgi:hypothetical protein